MKEVVIGIVGPMKRGASDVVGRGITDPVVPILLCATTVGDLDIWHPIAHTKKGRT
jgi:hypothetical protein